MNLDVFFPEDLYSRIVSLELAIEGYPPDGFRDGALFALGLVRVSLGLETTLTIPIPSTVADIETKLLERRKHDGREGSDFDPGR